ncbi:MAG: leucyl/phenylalanyl-tRNA--protein transferase [Myxococcota bacterium]
MPVFALTDALRFPPPHLADPNGILAVGGDLRPERLLLAYQQGIFPWYDEDLPILWHSPDPRMVLLASELRVSRSLKKRIKQRPFRLTCDVAFREVITRCRQIERPDQEGTWLTDEMVEAYVTLHELGFAHSTEAWRDDELVGGLYGVSLGAVFFGESMFATANDASKIAFVHLVEQLNTWGITLIDCQVHTDHLARFGAEEWPRPQFLEALDDALHHTTRRGVWAFDPS